MADQSASGSCDDLDVNSSKLGPTVAKRNEKLVRLLDTIGDLPLSLCGVESARLAPGYQAPAAKTSRKG